MAEINRFFGIREQQSSSKHREDNSWKNITRNRLGHVVADSVIVTGDSNVTVSEEGSVDGLNIKIDDSLSKKVVSQDQAFERIWAATKSNLLRLEENISQARKESNQFFKLTLLFSSLGFLVVLSGVVLLLLEQTSAGIVSAVSSIIPEVTALLFFRKDKELRVTIERYHRHTLESQRILTMIDVSETIKRDEERDLIKKKIIYTALGIKGTDPTKRLTADTKKPNFRLFPFCVLKK